MLTGRREPWAREVILEWWLYRPGLKLLMKWSFHWKEHWPREARVVLHNARAESWRSPFFHSAPHSIPVIVHSEMRSVPCVQFGKHGAFCSECPESGSHGLISIYLNEPSLQQIGTSELVSLPWKELKCERVLALTFSIFLGILIFEICVCSGLFIWGCSGIEANFSSDNMIIWMGKWAEWLKWRQSRLQRILRKASSPMHGSAELLTDRGSFWRPPAPCVCLWILSELSVNIWIKSFICICKNIFGMNLNYLSQEALYDYGFMFLIRRKINSSDSGNKTVVLLKYLEVLLKGN